MKAEDSEVRFGVLAVQKGFVKPEQAVEALEIQVKENLSNGVHRRVGDIMVEKGYMDSSQVKAVLAALKREGPSVM
jgi:hypothetical protein